MSTKSANTAGSPHPMVAVPAAIRMVLDTTATAILEAKPSGNESDVLSTNAPASHLIGRILAEDVLMREPGYPPFRASIMDGYAIQSNISSSFQKTANSWTHQVSGRVHAGPSSMGAPMQGSNSNLPFAVYVTTGARIPDNYDCVVPIELIEESSDQKQISIAETAAIEAGKWIRNVGCDIPAGSVVLSRGSCLDHIALGLLQQSGQSTVKLAKPIKVGVLSTGNELLLSPDTWANQSHANNGTLIQTGQIPDVNKPMLMSLLRSFGKAASCQPIDLGMERDDDMEAMTKTLRQAVDNCDVILTTGGISMGETDIVEDVLVRGLGGTLHFGRLNMKPGKPTTFVTIPSASQSRTCLVFALPGNPVSAFVCTHLVVRPALSMLLQQQEEVVQDADIAAKRQHMVRSTWMPPEIVAALTHDLKLDMERPEYHRVVLRTSENEYIATSTGVQRSSRLMSLRDAQGLLVLPQGTKEEPKAMTGERFPVILLGENHLGVRFQDSRHMKQPHRQPTPNPPLKVAVLQLSESKAKYPLAATLKISNQVETSLSGRNSGSVKVVSCQDISNLPDLIATIDQQPSSDVDFCIVSCAGSFPYCLQVSQLLRGKVGKVADSVALQIRRGAASQDGTTALFEPVVGYISAADQQGCILVALPQSGVEGGLSNVRGLLKHALNVAQGRPHNHHHSHQHRNI